MLHTLRPAVQSAAASPRIPEHYKRILEVQRNRRQHAASGRFGRAGDVVGDVVQSVHTYDACCQLCRRARALAQDQAAPLTPLHRV